MSYNSARQQLIMSVESSVPPAHKHYKGRQVMALCRYLHCVSRVHSVVSYKALMAYTTRNYLHHDFPLNLDTAYRIIYDMEMRRKQTLKLLADYKLWYKDPVMHSHLNRRICRRDRKNTWQIVTEHISILWPTAECKWPQKFGST